MMSADRKSEGEDERRLKKQLVETIVQEAEECAIPSDEDQADDVETRMQESERKRLMLAKPFMRRDWKYGS